MPNIQYEQHCTRMSNYELLAYYNTDTERWTPIERQLDF